MKNLQEILQLKDDIEIIETIGTIIWDKKEENDTLTEGEKNFVLIDIFEGVMNEGGFSYFFKSESGDFAREVVEAYKKVGATKTANLIAKAIGLFGINNYHDTHIKRQNTLTKLDEKVFSAWEDLDELFFNEELEEDIIALLIQYIKENQNYFNYKN
ncbi:DUF4375 domain-containing protein [Flavobacterium sp. J27]|uniref:DMP19 family protein n=1 Tax=Flavobacterium sp. J27 TaxID=2060419 RepID=UPI001030C635|nr:DUF4375 domain-containing protein [Flavobacterium sp. J27]